ncbi:hypothetical protein ALI144C_48670 [Actinosynnema sp. ALI-1.44]|nr:hypothetical protein ALI144C_48670 [Actinosynnema sp. ALI-1.44]
MRMARAVSNPELEAIANFRLDGKDRIGLNDLRLVASHKEGRCYVHELTDQGWAWCDDELSRKTPPPPSPRSSLASAAYVVFGGFNEYLRRDNLRLFEIFTANAELTPDGIEERIRDAYNGLARSPGSWVGLVDLRPKLGDAPADAVDAVLKELSRTGRAHLVPESNRKVLTEADHDAAIRIGGEENHLISIEVS